MRPPLPEVGDPRRQPLRVQAQAQNVDRRLEQSPGHPGQQRPGDVVGRDERPVPVDGVGGVGLVCRPAPGRPPGARPGGPDRRARAPGRRGRSRPPGADEFRSRSGHVQALHQAQQHLPARPRPPGLQEAEVACRNVGLEGEGELAEAPALPPAARSSPTGCVGRDHHRRLSYPDHNATRPPDNEPPIRQVRRRESERENSGPPKHRAKQREARNRQSSTLCLRSLVGRRPTAVNPQPQCRQTHPRRGARNLHRGGGLTD